MAFTLTNLANYVETTGQNTSLTTGSLSIPANSVVLVGSAALNIGLSAGVASVTDSVDGATGWAAVTNGAAFGDSVSYDIDGAVFYKVFSGATTRTITITYNTSNHPAYNIVAIEGADTSNPIVQAKAVAQAWNDSGEHSQAVTLDASPVSGNAVIWMLGRNNDGAGAATLPSGYTSLSNTATSYQSMCAAYHLSTTAATVTCTDIGTTIQSAYTTVVEIKSGTPPPPASLKATGAWAETITDPTTATLVGTPAATNRYFLFAVWKAFGTTCQIVSPQAWTEVTEYTDGAVAAGANVGSVKVACFYRDWQSGDGDPSIDWSAAPAPAAYVMQLFQKEAGYNWGTPVFATQTWPASIGPETRDASSTLTVPDKSVVFGLAGIRDDSAIFTRPATAISATSGVTWWTDYVESPATHFSTTTSNDISADLGHRFVDTGGSGITLQMTISALSASETGALLWVVQPVTPAPFTVSYCIRNGLSVAVRRSGFY